MNRPRIWIPEILSRPILQPSEIITIPVGTVQGWFFIQLLDRGGKNVLKEWSIPNVITNDGMDRIGDTVVGENVSAIAFMQAGQGSTTPTGTDTGLASSLSGRAQNNDGTYDLYSSGTDASGTIYHFFRNTYLFTETQAVGNVAELGLFTLSSGGRLFARVLVKDSGGSPTTIAKTSDNQLRVMYEFRVYPPKETVTGTFAVGTASFDYTIKPANIYQGTGWGSNSGTVANQSSGVAFALTRNAWSSNVASMKVQPSGAIGDVTGNLIGTGSTNDTPTSITVSNYVAGTYYREIEYQFDPTDGNFGSTGIKSINISPWLSAGVQPTDSITFWQYQMVFTTSIPKDNTKRFKMKFRYAWQRSRTSD